MTEITESASGLHADNIKRHIRTVPDWPAPGVQFRDITPLLSNPRVFRVLIDAFVHRYFEVKPVRSPAWMPAASSSARFWPMSSMWASFPYARRASGHAVGDGGRNVRAGIRLGHGGNAHRCGSAR